jgi:hypothetical protein
MAKYSVNGTEVIKDTGTIDWTKIKNAPIIYGPQRLTVLYTNCSTQGNITVVANTATGNVNFSFTASGGAGYDCDCDCVCACDCACMGG